MSCSLRPARYHRVRCRPRIEPLESRQLFALLTDLGTSGPLPVTFTLPASSNVPSTGAAEGTITRDSVQAPDLDTSVLSVIQTTPSDGATLIQSPTDLLITFNQPFDPFSLSFSDIVLEQVASDGTVTPLDPSVYSEPFFLDNPTATLDVTVNQPLAPGHYRIVLSGLSELTGLDSEPLATQGVDTPLADFTIETPGVSLADATPLPALGSTPVVVSSSLDFWTPMGEAQLYKFTLPATQPLWRLGAEVSAQRDGSSLHTALVLLDQNGQPITIGDYGRKDAPNDPFLFAGLKPGTYYLGVSGAGDLPGQPGGYDPADGIAGTITQSQPGGPFSLHVAADPASPTTLVSLQLDQADALVADPTGFSVQFSGPLSIDSLEGHPTGSGWLPIDYNFNFNPIFQALQVVDQTGKVWQITPSAYSESTDQFSFLFDQPLPPGHYSLIVPTKNGATDLAGQAPTASGEPAGVLATWTVTAPSPTFSPTDFGPLLANVVSGLNGSDTLAPGTQITYRFVVPTPGPFNLFKLTTVYTGGELTIFEKGSNGTVALGPLGSGVSNLSELNLQPGVYQLVFSNPGTTITHLSWILKRTPGQWEQILASGVGQGPALQLMLLSTPSPAEWPTPTPTPAPTPTPTPSGPTATTLTPSPGGNPSTPSSSPTSPETPFATPSADPATGGASIARDGTSAPGTSASSGTSGLLLTLEGALVGLPTLQAEHVSAVGPGSSSTTALATGASGLLPGINYGSMLGSKGAGLGEDAPTPADPDPLQATDGSMIVVQAPGEPGPDDRVLAMNDWIGRIGPALFDWIAPAMRNVPTLTPAPAENGAAVAGGEPAAPAERIVLSRDDLPLDSSEGIDRADFAAPIGLVATAVGAMRLRRPLQKWFRRKGTESAAAASSRRSQPRGPHVRI
jgi:hypothetical protein